MVARLCGLAANLASRIRLFRYGEEANVKSSELLQHGLGSWSCFNRASERSLLAQLPAKPGVYAVRCSREYTRKIGSSDIIYFGSATNSQGLRMRLRQYFHPGPTQRTNKRILALVGHCSDFEVSYVETKSVPDAKRLEARLLEQYERDHGELPPENKRR